MAVFDPYYEWLGIPPKDQPPHHYRLLGVELYEGHLTAIDAAANRIMAYLQELSNGDNGPLAQQLLNEVSTARVCLLNKKRKAAYDQTLKTTLSNKKQKKKNQPTVAKKPPPLPTATPLETEATPAHAEVELPSIPRISTDDNRQQRTGRFTGPGPTGRRTTRRSKSGDKKILLAVISLLLIVAVALGIVWFQQPKASPKTGKATAPKETSTKRSLNQNNVIGEARDLAFSVCRQKKIPPGDIAEITDLLIRPHWKQIAAIKDTKRMEFYRLAIKHAEKLYQGGHVLWQHELQYNEKPKTAPGRPRQLNDQAARQDYRKKHGNEFEAELAQLLETSE
jgi:hypothetical protein